MPDIRPDEFEVRPAGKKRGPWLFLMGIGLLLAMLLGLVMVMAPGRPRSQPPESKAVGEARLSDGTVLRLEQVTYGQRHQIDLPIPGASRNLFGGQSSRPINEGTQDNRLMLWFTRRDGSRGRSLDFPWWSHCIALDERGGEMLDEDPGQHQVGRYGHSSSSGSRPLQPMQSLGSEQEQLLVAHSSLRPFRHSGETFKLQVFNTSGEMVAEFDVPNPVRGPFPEWTPDELPATKTVGELSVTLKQLRPHWTRDSERQTRRLDINPQFSLEQDGKSAKHWVASATQVVDALGNQSGTWNCNLSPQETAWKLQVKLYRSEKAAFDPSEVFATTSHVLPAKDQTLPARVSQNVQGLQVELLALGGSGFTRYTGLSQANGSSGGSGGDAESAFEIKGNNGATTVQSKRPHVAYRLTGRTPDHQVNVTATDDQGREVEVHEAGFSDLQFGFLKVAPDAKSIDLKFTVQKYRQVEFLIAPPQEGEKAK